MIAIVVAVVLVRQISARYYGPVWNRMALYAGSIVGSVIVYYILSAVLSRFQVLSGTRFEADRLRMVIFAGTLIILMLIRPQGIFAHHEFSWSWVKKILHLGGGKKPSTAVAA